MLYLQILQLFNKCTCQRKLQTVCYGGGKFQIITGERKTTIFVKVNLLVYTVSLHVHGYKHTFMYMYIHT